MTEPLVLPKEIPERLSSYPDAIITNYEFLAGLEPFLKNYGKPLALRIIPANIPQELKDLPQWFNWKYEWDGKRWTKPPFRPSGFKASKINPAHFSDFEKVLVAYENKGFDGIGFVLIDNDPFVAIDLDDCLNGSVLTDKAREIIKTMNSYTEISPSGTGIRIFAKGTISRNLKKEIEMYSHDWYVTVTGRLWT